MARQCAKRKLISRPGLLEAAAALDTNYSHLRRVVIGERKSRSLLARYRAWRKQQRAGLLEIARAATHLANRS